MTGITLGTRPEKLTVVLPLGSDFLAVLVLDSPATWGVAPVLSFADGAVWTAEISVDGSEAALMASVSEVSARAGRGPQVVELSVGETLLARGSTEVVG